jgi:hypothetical protein
MTNHDNHQQKISDKQVSVGEEVGVELHSTVDTEHLYDQLHKKSFWFENTTFANLSAGLLLFYIALLSNFTGELAPLPIVKWVRGSRIAKQLIGFLLLLYTINLYVPAKMGFPKIIGYTFILWIWFLLTAKQRWRYSFTIFILLLISFTTLNLVDDIPYNKSISKENKAKIIRYCNLFQNISFVVIILLSVVGSAFYFYDEYREYRDQDDSFWKFILKYLLLARKTNQKTVVITPTNITAKVGVPSLGKKVSKVVKNVSEDVSNNIGTTVEKIVKPLTT